MARTSQTNTARFLPVWHKTTSRDHEGQPIVRIRYSTASEPIPEDFRAVPLFAIQIYSTFPLESSPPKADDEDGATSAKRPRGEHDADGSVSDNLKKLLTGLGLTLENAQRPRPLLEIYEPQTDPLECIAHQKREIAHRKQLVRVRDSGEDPDYDPIPIPMMTRSPHGGRRDGFCIILTEPFDSSLQQDRPQILSDELPAPLWAFFFRPFGSEADSNEAREVPELQLERKQKIADLEHDLQWMYFNSCEGSEDHRGVAGVDDALGKVEGSAIERAPAQSEEQVEALATLAERLSVDDFQLDSEPDKVTISSGEGEPDLKYIIYVLIPKDSSNGLLEQTAKAFAQAFSTSLPQKTFSFEFRASPEPTIPATLRAYASSSETDSASIGVQQEDGTRQHALDPDPATRLNDPESCGIEPFKTFLVVIDQPTAIAAHGDILFILTDGGRHILSDTDPNENFDGPSHDYVETFIWRAQDMSEVVKRLQLASSRIETAKS